MALSESLRSYSPKDGIHFMQDTKLEKPTQQHPPTNEFIQERERIFKETSNPGDILDMKTGEIIRNHAYKVPHTSSSAPFKNINDLAADEVERELKILEARQKTEGKVATKIRRPSLDFRGSLRRAFSHTVSILR